MILRKETARLAKGFVLTELAQSGPRVIDLTKFGAPPPNPNVQYLLTSASELIFYVTQESLTVGAVIHTKRFVFNHLVR